MPVSASLATQQDHGGAEPRQADLGCRGRALLNPGLQPYA